MDNNQVYIVIGVSGSGKSTIARILSKILNINDIDADDYHSKSNILKMKSGQPLNDDDRMPWLEKLSSVVEARRQESDVVLACSALKEDYRKKLQEGISVSIRWIVLEGSYELILHRMKIRNHFMPHKLLKSQYETWENPDYGLHINIENSLDKIENTLRGVLKEKDKMNRKSKIGLIGLGVMGKSLARNIARNDFALSVYNRHVDDLEVDVAKNFVKVYSEMESTLAFDNLQQFVSSIDRPRSILLMVNAGAAVDAVIDQLSPLLDKEDVIIDGGNSHFKDTERRYLDLKQKGIGYIGSGVSGGEEGALKGPSIMPGGDESSYDLIREIVEKIAARDSQGGACCSFIGKGGSGHFVKMVHNGIEYAEMQLIAEVYGMLRFGMNKTLEEISNIFQSWNEMESGSYLLEITTDILRKKEGEKYLIDIILDRAGNKGTGSWTTIAACELGVAIPTITAALFARYQSSYYDQRQKASSLYKTENGSISLSTEALNKAYHTARIINHHQGFQLIKVASENFEWNINFQELARIWTNGCIIRSIFMERIASCDSFDGDILLNRELNRNVNSGLDSLSHIVKTISNTSISAPCMMSACSYIKGFMESQSLANIIQAQRDYFGAHTYERKDAPRGQKFHTEW